MRVCYSASMSRVESPIQNAILSQLKNAVGLRYSEMQPKGVPNDLYNYHLQYLVKRGLVRRDGEAYALSSAGAQYVADAHAWGGKNNSFFKLNVITIVSRLGNTGVEILNQVRTSHPSYGKIGAPGGVVCKEEGIEAAARRKLAEETGLTATFRHVGMERRMLYHDGDLFSDVLFPFCYADASEGVLYPETPYGRHLWVPLEEAIHNESAPYDSLAGIVRVLHAVRDGAIEQLPYFYMETAQREGEAAATE
jgi:8-oxo-dGTP pyrophosphatase MutT (NUDIX family)